MEHRILVLEATVEGGGSALAQLARSGFVIDVAHDLEAATDRMQDAVPALAVVAAPVATAAEMCERLRHVRTCPIIVICPDLCDDSQVSLIDAGADRVLPAGLSRRELAARMRAAVEGRKRTEPASVMLGTHRLGDLMVDETAHSVTVRGQRVTLTPTEFRLLGALARRSGSTVPHHILLDEVWGGSPRRNLKTLRLYISYLRRKLSQARGRPGLLVSQRAIGYRLAVAGQG